MNETNAYKTIQDYFLKNDYDYLMIYPDDLLVSSKDVSLLMFDMINYRFQVCGGFCNVDQDWYKEYMNISLKPFKPDETDQFRYFEKFEDYFWHDKLKPEYQEKPIIRTMWQGFPLTCIRRDVLEEIKIKPNMKGYAVDDAFCWDCIQNEIPMYTDLRIRMNHLKYNDNNTSMQLVQNKEPYTKLVKKTRDFKIDVLDYASVKK